MDLTPDTVASIAAAIATGCVGGTFFAFSAFVMPALDRLPAPASIVAMRSINVTAVRPALMVVVFGAAALSAGLVVRGLAVGETAFVLGGAVYLVGTIGVTIAGNVPLNNRLASEAFAGTAATVAWRGYSRRWTRLNTIRTLAALAAATLFAVAAH